MQQDEAPDGHPVVDLVLAQPERQELRPRNDPLLLRRQPGYFVVRGRGVER
jgi:hypothetical protein